MSDYLNLRGHSIQAFNGGIYSNVYGVSFYNHRSSIEANRQNLYNANFRNTFSLNPNMR